MCVCVCWGARTGPARAAECGGRGPSRVWLFEHREKKSATCRRNGHGIGDGASSSKGKYSTMMHGERMRTKNTTQPNVQVCPASKGRVQCALGQGGISRAQATGHGQVGGSHVGKHSAAVAGQGGLEAENEIGGGGASEMVGGKGKGGPCTRNVMDHIEDSGSLQPAGMPAACRARSSKAL